MTLRWVNNVLGAAKGQFSLGKYVDITTEFSCSPGLVVEFQGPDQLENSTVTFVISTEAGAQPGRYHPEKGDVRKGLTLGKAASGHSQPRAPRVTIPPAMLELARRREPPSGLAAQLSERAAKAPRSMVVYIDNRTPFSFTQKGQSTQYGSWTQEGQPPPRIEPNQLVVVVSESSLVAGTEASVTYTGEYDTGQGVAKGSFHLHWVNPKVVTSLGRYVETKTNFNCNPGLVIHRTGPDQTDNASVRFMIEMKDGAQPMHFNPAKHRTAHVSYQATRRCLPRLGLS